MASAVKPKYSCAKRLPYDPTPKPEDVNPGYFIVRPNGGPLVPLIPIDELPVGLDFVGLKRSIEVEDTIGMANLGIKTNKVGSWKLVEKKPTELEGNVGKNERVATAASVVSSRPMSGQTSTANATPNTTSSQNATPVRVKSGPIGTPNQASPSPTVAGTKSSTHSSTIAPTPPTTTPKTPQISNTIQPPTRPTAPISTSSPTQNKSTVPAPTGRGIIGPFEAQICKHWCAYGTCKWGENCRYLHMMPTSRAGLQEVGLADFPGWWRALVGIPLGFMNDVGGLSPSNGIRLTEKEREKERARIGRLSVYPTGPRERFSRGLDIDYGRTAGDAKLAREWEERLMRERGRMKGKVVRWVDGRLVNVEGGANGKGRGKQRRGAVVKPEFLQTVIRDGKIVGVTIGDGSPLKTAKSNIDVKGGEATSEKTDKKQEQVSPNTPTKLKQSNPATVENSTDSMKKAKQESILVQTQGKGKRRETDSEMTTEKKLERDVVRATMAWEDDDGDENKENEDPSVYAKREMEDGRVAVQLAGVLVDI